MVGGWVSIFEQLTKVQPIEEALMDLASEEPAMLRYLDRLVEFWLTEIERMMSAGIDAVQFGDDFGTQDAPIISPAMFRKIFKRHYETLFAPVHKAGGKVFFHSCGHLDEILDELIDLGIDVLWPQSAIFDANPSFLEKCQKNKVALYVHPDRQYLIPLGSPKEIETTIKRYADRYHALGGGGIFHVEMENDAPFENVKALIEAIDRWR
jgi:uroporphyrinogen-III decarboxylase